MHVRTSFQVVVAVAAVSLTAFILSSVPTRSTFAQEKQAEPPAQPAAAATPALQDTPRPPAVSPDAERAMKTVNDTLTAAKTFSFKAEAWEDVVIGAGHKLTTTKTVQVELRRPDGLHVEIVSPRRSRGIWYDGKSINILDRAKNLYGTVAAPATLDETLDNIAEKYGITVPLDDLLMSDPYAAASKNIRSGAYLGKTTVLGTPCIQLAFSTDVVDWQVWLEDGGQGLPRKVVITYRKEDAAPQYTAIFSDWQLNPTLADNSFTFTPPEGSAKIEVLAARHAKGDAADNTEPQ